MKNFNFLRLILGLFGFVLLSQSCSKEEEKILTIEERLQTESPLQIVNSGVSMEDLYGKMYEGGLIFYLNTSDGTGLVAAPSNQMNARWGCYEVDIPNLNNIADLTSDIYSKEGARVGDGKNNTAAILAAQCEVAPSAAKVCGDLVLFGKDDWFLPSLEELDLMYKNLKVNGHSDFPEDKLYCSSTESDATNIWVQFFDAGSRIALEKSNQDYSIRAVRAF